MKKIIAILLLILISIAGTASAASEIGDWFNASYFKGDGSYITTLNASNITIGTVADERLSSNVVILDSNDWINITSISADGGILALGTFGSGADLSVSGAGTRLIWYPKKAAFRAGYVQVNEWDDANIGLYSVAIGYRTTANGSYSAAMGVSTIASGSYSAAMGRSTTASGMYSTALGYQTTASESMSTAIGYGTTASGAQSTAIGYGATASGIASIAMGKSTIASGSYSTSMGRSTIASGSYSTSMGYTTTASGIASTTMGLSFVNPNDYSLGIGNNALNILFDADGLSYINSGSRFGIGIAPTIGAAVFTGSGLDDMTSGGLYSGTTDLSYRVQIDGESEPDTFKWSDDGGSTWDVETVLIDGTAQALNNGVTVTFAATIGHTYEEYWDFTTTTVLATLHVKGDAIIAENLSIRNIPYIWPNSQGSADTYLKNDGSGVLSWSAVSSGVTNETVNPWNMNAANLTSGNVSSAQISGSYTGITGVGALTAGTWNANLIDVAYLDLEDLNATNITSGTIPSERLPAAREFYSNHLGVLDNFTETISGSGSVTFDGGLHTVHINAGNDIWPAVYKTKKNFTLSSNNRLIGNFLISDIYIEVSDCTPIIRIGFGDLSGTAIETLHNNSAYFFLSPGAEGTWHIITNNGTGSSCDYGISAPSDGDLLTVEIIGSSKVNFYKNGILEGTCTQYVPSSGILYGGVSIGYSSGGTSDEIDVDMMSIEKVY